MKKLDFHIDESILHDATINSKKDFKQLMKDFKSSEGPKKSLQSVWIMGSICCGFLLLGLSWMSINDTTSIKESNQYILMSSPHQQEPQPLVQKDDHVLAVNGADQEHTNNQTEIFEKEEVILNETLIEQSVRSSNALDQKEENTGTNGENIDLIVQDEDQLVNAHLDKVNIKHPSAVKTASPRSIPVGSIKVPSGLELNVDLITYAELKKNKAYFFEVDTVYSKADEDLFQQDWDEADLKRHPLKNRYKMVLKKDGQSKEVIVRLVKSPLQIKRAKKHPLFSRR